MSNASIALWILPDFGTWQWWTMLVLFVGLIAFFIWYRKRKNV